MDDKNDLLLAIKSALHFFGKEEKEIDVHEMVLVINLNFDVIICSRSKCSSQLFS